MRDKAIFITPTGCALIAYPGGDEIKTLELQTDRYIRIDDEWGRHPQLCKGGERCGATLKWDTPEALARDCNGRLYKTEAGYERAKERLADIWE